jgi:PIN domain nuclease of toxin-antitoxin system
MIVLDASAFIALLLTEPGHETVEQHIATAAISAVNLAEVLARTSRERISSRILLPKLEALGLTIIDFDQPQAVVASDIREHARAYGLGLADCCCLALAMNRAWPVMTADRIWTTLGFDIDVRLIR